MKLSEKKIKEHMRKKQSIQYIGLMLILLTLIGIAAIMTAFATGNVFYSCTVMLLGLIVYSLAPQMEYNFEKYQKLKLEIELEKLKE